MGKRNYSTIDKEVYNLILQRKSLNLEEIIDEVELTEERARKSLDRLEKRGKIQKEKIIIRGRYSLVANLVDNYGMKVKTRKNKTVWKTFGNLPCFTCPAIAKCKTGVGSKEQKNIANPLYCDYIRDYINKKLENKKYEKVFQPDFEDIRKKRGRKNDDDDDDDSDDED